SSEKYARPDGSTAIAKGSLAGVGVANSRNELLASAIRPILLVPRSVKNTVYSGPPAMFHGWLPGGSGHSKSQVASRILKNPILSTCDSVTATSSPIAATPTG